MKWLFKIVGFTALALCLIAVLSTGREWLILYHFNGYKPLEMVIEEAKREVSQNDTEWLLIGSSGSDKIEFHISPAQYERFSGNNATGTKLRIWKNDAFHGIADITFQNQSLKVILDEDWRPYHALRWSALSTSGIAVLLLAIAITFLVFDRKRVLMESPPESPAS